MRRPPTLCPFLAAFRDTPYFVVLSVPSADRWSAVDAAALGALPNNFFLNTRCSHLDILPRCCLFIGQGGPGSTLEALYCGVPLLLLPPTTGHEISTRRVVELGLGCRLSLADASATALRQTAEAIMADGVMHARLEAARAAMVANSGGKRAADLIERELRGNSRH
jgi:MGT family glycosyltransferase